MIGAPKPQPVEKARKPLRRNRSPIARQAIRQRQRQRIKQTNAYQCPEWRALVRQKHKESRKWCQYCDNAPVEGDPHHLRYNEEFTDWRRLIVPLAWLLDCCRSCHKRFHPIVDGKVTHVSLEDDFYVE